VRFQREQSAQMTHSLPFLESNANLRPIGKCSTLSFVPSAWLQKMQVEYIADGLSDEWVLTR
jgi:hypothetical protein